MRIKQKYKHGDTRIKTFFAFFPVTVDFVINQKETRWLEMVTVEETLFWSMYKSKYYWQNTKFINK